MCAVKFYPASPEEAQETYHKPFTFSLHSKDLQQALAEQLAIPKEPLTPVVWSDGDSDLLIYPARVNISLQTGLVLVELPVEADQTGLQKLVIPISLGSSPGDAVLTAATEILPRGHSALAARWGTLIQDALWAALLNIGQDHLASLPAGFGMTVSGVFATNGKLGYIAAQPLQAQELIEYFSQVDPQSPSPPEPEPLPEEQWQGCVVILIRLFNWLLRRLGLPAYQLRAQK